MSRPRFQGTTGRPQISAAARMAALRLAAAAAEKLTRRSPSEIAEAMAHPLSSGELADLLDGCGGVATYDTAFSGVRNGEGLREALRRQPGRACVFLWRSEPRFGHWVAAFEGPGKVPYVFDSYGRRRPDAWRRARGAAALGQDSPLLLEGMIRSGYPCMRWNEFPMQRLDPEVQTCGRWAVVRIALKRLNVREFANAIHSACDLLGIDPDTLVTAATMG